MMIIKNETKTEILLSTRVISSKIFLGKKGLGKYTVAKTMAAEILGVSVEKLAYESSFWEISGTLSIEELRKMLQNTLYKASKCKILLVDQAESLSVDEQNVLLKTIEEEKSIIFFVTSQKLLDTIHSRCHTIEFSAYLEKQLEEELTKSNIEVEQTALQLCGGCPGNYFNLIKEKNFLMEMKDFLNKFQHFTSREKLSVLLTDLGLLNDKSESSFFEKYNEWQVIAVLEGILNIYTVAFLQKATKKESMLPFLSISETEECIKYLRKLIINTQKTKQDCLEVIMYLIGGKDYVVQ